MAVRYQAIGPLLAGEGSRAFLGLEVYDDGRSYPVVLVWLPEGSENDKALFEKIRRETEHAAKLDHPNIVHVHGFGQLDEGYARVVEYADGETLRKIIERAGKVPALMAVKIICDAATGVHYAHVAGNDDGTPLVHGDIRPETLLVSFNGLVKVTGYGALAFAPREMGGQRVKGRRVHTAPEQIIGGRESFSLTTDVYLLGVTLYECMTGLVPFAEQADFFDHAVLTLPLPPMEPGLAPEGLEKVLAKACAKKLNDRYPTPLAFREALEAAVGTLPTNEELAAWLKQQFPGSDEARAARRQTIDTAIADAARKLWGARGAPPPAAAPDLPAVMALAPVTPPTPIQSPVVKVTNPSQPPKHVDRKAPEPGIKITYQPPPELERTGTRVPWALVLVALAAVLGIWWTIASSNELPAARDGLAALADAGSKVEAVVVRPRAVVAATDGGVEAEAEDDGGDELAALPKPATADSGAAAPVAAVGPAVVDAGAVAVAPPAPKATPTVLQLEANPPVEVTMDGKIVGRTPIKLETSPGRKVLKLENKDLGINTGRVITLKEGVTAVENISIGTGSVVLVAPDGSAVFMDGKRIGTAPMKEIPVYEGAHRVLVTVGKAKWSEPFSIHSGENVRFNVELE